MTTPFPSHAEMACLRAWYEGMSAREAVLRYLNDKKATGQSSRALIGSLRRALSARAVDCHRPDLGEPFLCLSRERVKWQRRFQSAAASLEAASPVQPLVTDTVGRWLAPRTVRALNAASIHTLADLTVRVPRRKTWWAGIPGLGRDGAAKVEAFFAAYPELTHRAQELATEAAPVSPWERLELDARLDGSQGLFRAPAQTCLLGAGTDMEAMASWLAMHESSATQRSYRKEVERVMLWSIFERDKPLSSLTTQDATAYRSFLRDPKPVVRWIGPARPRESSEWRPFVDRLSPASTSYALSVINALFRWLIEQRYVVANPFAGLKVRGAGRDNQFQDRAFTDVEWALVRTIADALEWSQGWSPQAAQRLQFILDFCYPTGLRASELVGATLGQIKRDARDQLWLHLEGKGGRKGKVSIPPLALAALESYLIQRGLSVLPAKWAPATPLVPNLQEDGEGITAARLWAMLRRFFHQAAEVVSADSPVAAERLLKASTHWLRHTHATHALNRGVELTTVRDNLRHASIATTSTYLHTDDARRSQQLASAFSRPK